MRISDVSSDVCSSDLLPTLTYFLAYVPHPVALGLMCLLVGAVIMAWTVRLAPALRTPELCSYASLFIMMNSLTFFSPALIVFHDGWAALLIALSLALYRNDRKRKRLNPSH